MKNTIHYENCLPLISRMTSARNIKVESCSIDNGSYQIRGELTTNRADYEDIDKEIDVQGIVIRLTLRFNDNTITNAEFAMPMPGFMDICEHMPVGPEHLIGLKIDKGITNKINELYDKTKTCWDLQTLLLAMIRLIPSISLINGNFRIMDESLPPEAVSDLMKSMIKANRNICHAWSDQDGGLQKCIKEGDYEKILKRIGNRLLKRWKAIK